MKINYFDNDKVSFYTLSSAVNITLKTKNLISAFNYTAAGK